ncbi:hypothetical protein QTP88_002088 [Uroleucon formosanum]
MNKEDNNLEVKDTDSKKLLTEELQETTELVKTETTNVTKNVIDIKNSKNNDKTKIIDGELLIDLSTEEGYQYSVDLDREKYFKSIRGKDLLNTSIRPILVNETELRQIGTRTKKGLIHTQLEPIKRSARKGSKMATGTKVSLDKVTGTIPICTGMIPTCTGERDVHQFIRAYELACSMVDKEDITILTKFINMKLFDRALEVCRYRDVSKWEGIKLILLDAFEPQRTASSLQVALNSVRMRNNEDVSSYAHRVEQLYFNLCIVSTKDKTPEKFIVITEQLKEQTLVLFLKGLIPNLRTIVKSRNPPTLEAAMQLAKEEETELTSDYDAYQYYGNNNMNKSGNNQYNGMNNRNGQNSCLKSAAADAVRGIPVSADNYELVMNTLSDKFNRPRLVATSLVDKLLQSSAMTQESLNDLNTFVGTFSESISLDALKIPDAGSFILFSIAFRRLPVSTRKLFKANSTVDYPSIGQLLDFLRSRVAILEVVGESHKGSTNNVPSKSAVNAQGRVECNVQPHFASEPVLSINAWVLPAITSDLPRTTLHSSIKERYSNLALADPSFDITSPIDVLLDGDIYASIMDGRKFSVDKALPTAFSSVFGWILIGPVSEREAHPYQSMPVAMTVSIEGLMERFWQVEEPEAAPATFTDEGRCEKLFCEQSIRLPCGRFSVPLPFRAPPSADTFVGSRELAVRRFDALERKLAASPQLKSLYVQFMSEYISLGHMSVAASPGRYFIPHHAVYRPAIDENKIRVVFDASAQSSRGPSLNNCLFTGPKLQQDIVDILTRFRVPKYVFTTDICKMYRQILILPEYHQFQHILWRPSPHDELVEYELNTVTYGVNYAPYLALRVLQTIASDDCDNFEFVRNALTRQTYVDDICDGADTMPNVLKLQSDLISVMHKAGLELKKWASNTPCVLEAVPAADRVCAPMPFESVDGYGTKVLGLQWHPEGDYLCCALSLDSAPVCTKRGILSLVARIFDPLGVFAPAVFLAKSIMQRTWQLGMTWDELLPKNIHDEWIAFVSDLPSLLNIRVPRYLNSSHGAPCYLLGFCDASQLDYAAVVYVRMADVDVNASVFLIGTKTKLAPIKSLTIPRLELNAALLLARWLSRVRDILAPQLNIVGINAWSDSTIVLSWLGAPHEAFKIYVSNRVHQIRTLLPDCRWRHVDSVNNPADCASRGIMPATLAQHKLYWHGPQLAYGDPSEWDDARSPLPLCDLPELRPVSCAARVDEIEVEWFNRFSNYGRMLRVVAYMRRFIATGIRRVRRQPDHITPAYLQKSELDSAARILEAESQRVHFVVLLHELSTGKHVSSKPLARLAPFIDPDGVIRVGGRLRHSLLTYDCKHPILLSKRSHYAYLLCHRWHLVTCHAGPRVLTVLISRRFWIISLRSVLHNIITNCSVCVRFDAKRVQPLMADLPDTRVQQRRPFERVGVDYAGPLQMRETRLRKSRVFKIYIAVFICFTTKAVHLEVVTDLSTDAFLAAFDRFIARRGLPSDVFSDCGTNFAGADKKLRALIHSPEGRAAIAPHFGGLWEAAVRSTKRLLIRVIGAHIFTYEEFTTILARVEAVLNSRPLTPASTDPHDLECLTPSNFLIGQPLLTVPPRSGPEPARSLTDRWKLMDQCHQSFWRRWSSEYLITLQERSRWTKGVPNVKIDDMVVVVDNQNPPLLWRLGRIVELFPGTDGHVRVARVLTRAGSVVRPVVKLVPLPTK